MTINATIEGVDDWSRVIIKTERGTRLCDINCRTPDELRENPKRGDWHTMTGPDDEPWYRVCSDIELRLT